MTRFNNKQEFSSFTGALMGLIDKAEQQHREQMEAKKQGIENEIGLFIEMFAEHDKKTAGAISDSTKELAVKYNHNLTK